MKRFFIYLSYNGTRYHGWQVQPNGNSVQAELTKALCTILRTQVSVVGAGRTDAGVHARLMVAHFDVEIEIDPFDLVIRLNGLLPFDISVSKIVSVKEDAHARFDALSRCYEYHVHLEKNPFLTDFSVRVPSTLDFDAMNRSAAHLLEYSDFTSFSKLHTDVKTNFCTIAHAEWSRRDEGWIFTIEADRFLRNMVRSIVGTLFCVGKGLMDEETFCSVIEQKNRGAAAASAPAHGLYLVKVNYPNDLFL